MLAPVKDRVLVKKVKSELMQDEHILLPGQLKVGENLYAAEVIHPGDSSLKKGSLIYFSEFSGAAIIDYGRVLRKEMTVDEVVKEDNLMYVLAADDVMAIDEDYDFTKVREATPKGKSKV